MIALVRLNPIGTLGNAPLKRVEVKRKYLAICTPTVPNLLMGFTTRSSPFVRVGSVAVLGDHELVRRCPAY